MYKAIIGFRFMFFYLGTIVNQLFAYFVFFQQIKKKKNPQLKKNKNNTLKCYNICTYFKSNKQQSK